MSVTPTSRVVEERVFVAVATTTTTERLLEERVCKVCYIEPVHCMNITSVC